MDATSPALLWEMFVGEIYETSATLVFYGLYVILFIIAIFTLSRRQTAGKTLLLTASWSLFLVGTVQTILRVFTASVCLRVASMLVVPSGSTTGASRFLQVRAELESAEEAIFVINVLLTDLLFFYRCYLIYGRQRKVVIFPGFLIFLTSCSAIISLATSSQSTPLGSKVHLVTALAGYGIGLFANLVLMGLTAGRIWWMSRASSHPHLQKTLKSRYNATASIILESGAIYCFFAALLAVALSTSGSSSKFYLTTEGIAFQAVNIAPTLTVVRVGLGHNIEDSIRGGASALKATIPKALEGGGALSLTLS